MFIRLNILTRPFAGISTALMLFGAVWTSEVKAQETGDCQHITVVQVKRGTATGANQHVEKYGFNSAICVDPTGTRLTYDMDSDIDTLPVDKMYLSKDIIEQLKHTGGKLSEAVKRVDLQRLEEHIAANSPVTAALRTDLPVYDLAGHLIAANLNPTPMQLPGGQLRQPDPAPHVVVVTSRHRHHHRRRHRHAPFIVSARLLHPHRAKATPATGAPTSLKPLIISPHRSQPVQGPVIANPFQARSLTPMPG